MNALRGGVNPLLVGAVILEGGYDTSFALNEHQAQEELPYQRQDWTLVLFSVSFASSLCVSVHQSVAVHPHKNDHELM